MNYRVFVEKKEGFQVEAQSLRKELNASLSLSLSQLRLVNVYDLFGFDRQLLDKCLYTVFGERPTDRVTTDFDLEGRQYLAVEYLPDSSTNGQARQKTVYAL